MPSLKDQLTGLCGKLLFNDQCKQMLLTHMAHCLSCLSGSLKPHQRHLLKLLVLSSSAFVWLDLDFLDP